MTGKNYRNLSPMVVDSLSLDIKAFRVILAASVGAAAGAMLSAVSIPVATFGPICGAVAVAVLTLRLPCSMDGSRRLTSTGERNIKDDWLLADGSHCGSHSCRCPPLVFSHRHAASLA